MTNPLPKLESSIHRALKDAISKHGVLVPLIEDQYGNLLDGHHRKAIADELDIDYDITTREINEEDRADIIVSLNDARRQQLPTDQRRKIVKELTEKGYSQRAIAGAVGVDQKTIHRDQVRQGPHLKRPSHVTGRDGKVYIPQRRDNPRTQRRNSLPIEEPEELESHAPQVYLTILSVAAMAERAWPKMKGNYLEGIDSDEVEELKSTIDLLEKFLQNLKRQVKGVKV
jgi:ParB-like chromosome segregation protein Spo0J